MKTFQLINNNGILTEIHKKEMEEKPGFWFTLFFLSIFYPLAIPIGAINVKLVYILTIVFFVYSLKRNTKENYIYSNVYLKLFYFAISLLIFSAFISFAKQPVGSEKLFGAQEGQGGISIYTEIAINCLIFFTLIRYVRLVNIDFYELFKILLLFSLIVGYFRLAGVYYGFDVPFVYGRFRYGDDFSYSLQAHRIGGLEQAAIYGIVSLLVILNYSKYNFKYIIAFSLFIFLQINSGGRTSFFVLLIIIITYLTLFMKKKLNLFIGITAAVLIFLLLVPQDLLNSQFSRILSIEGGIQGQDNWRSTAYFYYLQNFLTNPIFGTGIQSAVYLGSDSLGDFLSSQLRGGGHGAYVSILSTFGLVGLTYLLIFVFGGIIVSWKELQLKLFTKNEKLMILFIFLMLISNSITYYTGYNGYNDSTLFCFTGLLVGIISKRGGQNN